MWLMKFNWNWLASKLSINYISYEQLSKRPIGHFCEMCVGTLFRNKKVFEWCAGCFVLKIHVSNFNICILMKNVYEEASELWIRFKTIETRALQNGFCFMHAVHISCERKSTISHDWFSYPFGYIHIFRSPNFPFNAI